MGKLIKTVVAVVGIVALVVATGGAGLGAVFTAKFAAVVLPVAFGLGVLVEVAGLITRKKPVDTTATSQQRLSKNVDPEAARKIVFGETIAPADIRYWETYGTDNTSYDEVVCVATHEIDSFGDFYLEDVQHTFDGSGNSSVLGSAFRWFGREVGVTGTTLAAGAGVKWTSTASMTGLAFYILRHVYTQEKWPKGFPTRITQIIKGAKVYDPRLDSTVPGGVGLHRIDDQDTWEYANGGVDIGKNAVLQVLWYLIGWRINGVLVAGLGVDTSAILLEDWQEAATDFHGQGWECDCVLSTGDSHETNIGVLESSCNGRLLDTGGLYTFKVAVDDTADIAVAFDEDDLAGPIEWVPHKKMRDQYNLIAGTYVDPSEGSLYQQKPFPIVEDDTYVTSDGYTRRLTNNYASVQSSNQARDLSRIDLNQTRFQGMFRAAFNYKAMIAKNWDVVTLTFSEFGWVDKLFRIVQYDITTKGIILLSLQETNSQIYTPGSVVTPPAPGIGVAYDPREQIAVTGFDAIAVSVTGDNIATQDGIAASFTTPSSAVLRTDLQYKLDADSSWTSTASLTEGETQTTISPLNPQTLYDVRARHVSIASVPGAWSTDSVTTGNDTVIRAENGVYDDGTTTIEDLKPDAPGATRQVNRGTFNVGSEYSKGDIVNESGSSYEYINETPSTGNTPPNATYWSLLASGGTGDPGVNSIIGLLTNEAVTVSTLDDGTGGDYSGAGGTFQVWDGITEVTGALGTGEYSKISSTAGLTIAIDDTTGVYTVTNLTVDQGQAVFEADYGTVQIERVYSIAKALGGVKGDDGDPGADAKGLHLAASSQIFSFDGTGTANPPSQTITFTSDPQNLIGSPVFTTDPVVTLGGTGNTRTLTVANFGVNTAVEVTVTQDGLSDIVSVVRIQDGTDGVDGDDTVTGFLTNEAVVVATLNNGIGGDYSVAGGTFKVFEGITDVTGDCFFTIPSPNIDLSISIASETGVYTVTDLAADTADVVLRATYDTGSGDVIIDKTYSISKSKTGGEGADGNDGGSGFTIVTNIPSNMELTPNSAEKISGGAAWDTEVRTIEGYANGTFVSFQANQTSAYIAMGLDTNPTDIPGRTNLDYAWYMQVGGILVMIKNGVILGGYNSTYLSSTVLSITYDGTTIRYLKDGIEQTFGTEVINITDPLYLDSSFYTVGGKINNITFGPSGSATKSLRLTADSQTFTYDGNGDASPASQTITFTAIEENLAGSYVFTTSPTVSLSGTGDTRTLTDANFGLNSAVTVTVTRDTYTDRITVVRLTDGSYGTLRDLIFIASATVPATPSGVSPAGWTNTIPLGETVWQSVSLRRTSDDVFLEDWSTPAIYQGVYKGTYSAVTTYFFGDQVTLNGTTFVRSSTSPVGLVGVSPPVTPTSNADWDVVAAKGDSGDPAVDFDESVIYSSGTAFNMLDLATNTYGYVAPNNATFYVTVTADIISSGGNAINTGDWPDTATLDLKLIIPAGIDIVGEGGNGGKGGDNTASGSNGNPGRHGINMSEDLTVENEGAIKGGSGGGGGGGGGKTSGPEPSFYGGGGGGGGWPYGSGGSRGTAADGNGVNGSNATAIAAGGGGAGGGGIGGSGGTGGGTGTTSGSSGSSGNLGGSGGSGGSAGNGIKQNGHTLSLSGGGTNTSTGA